MKSKTLHRGQFTFYASYYDAVSQLPKSRRLETLEAICRYGLYGELPDGEYRLVKQYWLGGDTRGDPSGCIVCEFRLPSTAASG